jgi:hypothetical protein
MLYLACCMLHVVVQHTSMRHNIHRTTMLNVDARCALSDTVVRCSATYIDVPHHTSMCHNQQRTSMSIARVERRCSLSSDRVCTSLYVVRCRATYIVVAQRCRTTLYDSDVHCMLYLARCMLYAVVQHTSLRHNIHRTKMSNIDARCALSYTVVRCMYAVDQPAKHKAVRGIEHSQLGPSQAD